MSSSVEASADVALAVKAAGTVVLGAGWLVWQSGKLLVEVNRAIDAQIDMRKMQLKAEEIRRKAAAIALHEQLVDMCSQIIAQLNTASCVESDEIEEIKSELLSICNKRLPDDVGQIESLNNLDQFNIENIIERRNKIAEIKLAESDSGIYQGLSVADLLNDFRRVAERSSIKTINVNDVVAINPDVLEKRKLDEEFSSITTEIIVAINSVNELSKLYGLTKSAKVWFESCFKGIDSRIEILSRPTTSKEELKKGIKILKDKVRQYKTMAPSIESDLKRASVYYNKVYVDAAKALGEEVKAFENFGNASDIEKELIYLQERNDRAQKCAEIYKKLGQAKYICYAYDQELKAMGYKVQTHQNISEMELFNKWKDSDLTQLYSISSTCALQVIVHSDGTVSMQTIAAKEDEGVIHEQKSHCSQLKKLRERLKKNWFILYEFKETKSPEVILTLAEWMDSNNIKDRRTSGKESHKTKQIK
jgi:hypothetical protein